MRKLLLLLTFWVTSAALASPAPSCAIGNLSSRQPDCGAPIRTVKSGSGPFASSTRRPPKPNGHIEQDPAQDPGRQAS